MSRRNKKKKKRTSKGYTPRKLCYESHPTLKLGTGAIYGGSCLYPEEGYDIYVGLDIGMHFLYAQNWPWEPEKKSSVIEFLFPIVDMQAPSSAKDFHKLILWLSEQLHAGKRIHVGCIGGHGRTGTVLSALVQYMTGESNSTMYVREHYCPKAVESTSQGEYLHKHYGVTRAPATKLPYEEDWGFSRGVSTIKSSGLRRPAVQNDSAPSKKTYVKAVHTKACIWS